MKEDAYIISVDLKEKIANLKEDAYIANVKEDAILLLP